MATDLEGRLHRRQTKASRLIGYSPSAEFVFTVIIDPEDSSGVTAWKTRGINLRHYLHRRDSTDD